MKLLNWCMRPLLSMLALGMSLLAQAHPMPQSQVFVDWADSSARLELRLPMDRLEIGFGKPLVAQADKALAQHGEALTAYLLEHIKVVGEDGAVWQLSQPELSVDTTWIQAAAADGVDKAAMPEVVALIAIQAPPGANLRRFQLHYDVITHEIVTHMALVLMRQDWLAGRLNDAPVLLGALRHDADDIAVRAPDVQAQGQAWRTLWAVIRLGMSHILEGTDHLLFLFSMLIPAPLLVAGGRWGGFKGARASWRSLGLLVTAFTVGHSVSLLWVGMATPVLPVKLIEASVALSILVTAAHALRPLFTGREHWVAIGFGLVHGMAFAESIAGLGLSTSARLWAILGFNLGIELMQLALLGVTLPWLLLLAKHGRYGPWRVAGGVFASAAAVAWLVQRLEGRDNPATLALHHLGDVAPLAWLALFAAALWARRQGSAAAGMT